MLASMDGAGGAESEQESEKDPLPRSLTHLKHLTNEHTGKATVSFLSFTNEKRLGQIEGTSGELTQPCLRLLEGHRAPTAPPGARPSLRC